MERYLTVDIKHKSWPPHGSVPAFPARFHQGALNHTINVPRMLLMIGYLTTPTASSGVSLSEFWAWVRYLAAISDEPYLRLTSSFAELDAHQKTILSDDFGMGMPMIWLEDQLTLHQIVDGSYFLERFAASVNAVQRKTAKRGPNKTPDFVARDSNGIWHIVECKGTQSGAKYATSQIGKVGPPTTGGIAQKRAIVFPPAYTGQRLVTALDIGIENGTGSRLTIVDPKPKKPFVVGNDQLFLADDAISRGVISKALRMTGFEATANTTASPLGPKPSSRSYATRSAEAVRLKFVEERDSRVQEELDQPDRERLFGGEYLGLERVFILPRTLGVGPQKIRRVVVRHGINEELVAQLRERPRTEDPTFTDSYDFGLNSGQTVSKGDAGTASMRIGEIYRSEIILEPQ